MSEQSSKKSRAAELALIVGLCIIFLGLFSMPVVCHLRRGKDPRLQEPKALVADIKAGRFDQAYERTTDEFRKKVGLPRFRQVLRDVPSLHAADVGTFTITSPANRAAKVEGTAKTARGEVEVLFYTRRTITGDRWRIAAIHVAGRNLFGAELGEQ